MINIKNMEGKIIFTSKTAKTIKQAVEEAILQKVSLQHSELVGVDFTGANLAGGDFRGSDLYISEFDCANCTGTDFTGANLDRTSFDQANLTDTKIDFQIEEGLLAKVAQHALANDKALDMDDWHTCDTVHCIAGWACKLAKDQRLETIYGTPIAGLLLLGTKAYSHFYDTTEEARVYLEGINKQSKRDAKKLAFSSQYPNLENEISALIFLSLKKRTALETNNHVVEILTKIVESKIKERTNPKA